MSLSLTELLLKGYVGHWMAKMSGQQWQTFLDAAELILDAAELILNVVVPVLISACVPITGKIALN